MSPASTVCVLLGLAGALPFGVAGCATETASPSTEAILGGRPATAADGLGSAALLLADTGDLDCSGTLVAPTVVVTAAHCVVEMNDAEDAIVRELAPSELVVRVGALDISSGEVVEVARLARDPAFLMDSSYDADGLGNEHDVAVAILAHAVAGPIVPLLPPDAVDAVLVDGTALTIAGYGDTSNATDAPYGVLMMAVTSFQRHDDTELLAAGAPTHDTCFGDSGGPALVQVDEGWRLAGITSRGATDAPCGATSSVYSLAPAYLDEISAWSGVSASELAPPVGSSAPPPDMPPPTAPDAGTHHSTHADAGTPTYDDPTGSSARPHHVGAGTCSTTPGVAHAPVALVLVALALVVRARRRLSPPD